MEIAVSRDVPSCFLWNLLTNNGSGVLKAERTPFWQTQTWVRWVWSTQFLKILHIIFNLQTCSYSCVTIEITFYFLLFTHLICFFFFFKITYLDHLNPNLSPNAKFIMNEESLGINGSEILMNIFGTWSTFL